MILGAHFAAASGSSNGLNIGLAASWMTVTFIRRHAKLGDQVLACKLARHDDVRSMNDRLVDLAVIRR